MKTVTLETAKLLKAAGFPQENSHYYWKTQNIYGVEKSQLVYDIAVEDLKGRRTLFAAPAAEEVLDQLPNGTRIQKNVSNYSCSIHYPKWSWVGTTQGENAAEAVAQIWLRLKKEGLLS
jgi:hypothetical protein